MKGADLKDADLKYFHLTGTNLVKADLSEATLYGAHLDRTTSAKLDLSKPIQVAYLQILSSDVPTSEMQS